MLIIDVDPIKWYNPREAHTNGRVTAESFIHAGLQIGHTFRLLECYRLPKLALPFLRVDFIHQSFLTRRILE